MDFVLAYLTCDNNEADKLSRTLLEKRLIVCARKTSVQAKYWWKDKIEDADETLLMLETAEGKIQAIEQLLKKIHSYETFVLTVVPLKYVSKDAQNWMRQNLA